MLAIRSPERLILEVGLRARDELRLSGLFGEAWSSTQRVRHPPPAKPTQKRRDCDGGEEAENSGTDDRRERIVSEISGSCGCEQESDAQDHSVQDPAPDDRQPESEPSDADGMIDGMPRQDADTHEQSQRDEDSPDDATTDRDGHEVGSAEPH
jgi:hypothetical protein